jgi:amino acid adenylation domain-containing protein
MLPPLTLDLSIPERFAQVVTYLGSHVAIVDGETNITYADLDSWSNQIAHALLHQGKAGNVPIALIFEHGAAVLAAMLGVLKAGCVYCVIDPAMPTERIVYILQDLDAPCVLTDGTVERLVGQGLSAPASAINVNHLPQTLPSTALARMPLLSDLAAIYYTSGTTGKPKGALRDHSMLLHRAWQESQAISIGPEDAVSLLYFAAYSASAGDIWGALLNGARLTLYRIKESGVAGLVEWLTLHRISFLHLHASVLHQLLDLLPPQWIFPHLRYVRPSDRTSISDLIRLRGHLLENAAIVHSLGSSETGQITCYVIRHDTELDGDVVPIGLPSGMTEVTLLDEEGKPVEGPGVGEIVVRSRYLSQGYWKQPEFTSQRFEVDPQDDRYQIYRMGDLARRREDGVLVLLGRTDMRVKIRGYTVDLNEVEAILLRLPAIVEAAAVAQSIGRVSYLVAYLKMAEGVPPPGVPSLRADLARYLPEYMIPSRFMVLPELPRLPNGKVDRRSLPAPGSERPHLSTPYVAPRTPFEEQLSLIWAEVLGLDTVGVDDNFLDLGGHSLQASQIIARILDLFYLDLPPRILFESATVASMAEPLLKHQVQQVPADEMDELLGIIETMSEAEAN